MMRRFVLVRHDDPSGVSGTGKVAEGVQFTDGHVYFRWCVPGKPPMSVVADIIDDVITIHGHRDENGKLKTEVEWIDEDYNAALPYLPQPDPYSDQLSVNDGTNHGD